MNHCLFKAKDTKGAVGNTVDYSSLTYKQLLMTSKRFSFSNPFKIGFADGIFTFQPKFSLLLSWMRSLVRLSDRAVHGICRVHLGGCQVGMTHHGLDDTHVSAIA